MNISASVGTEQINCLLSTVYLLPFSNILSLKPARMGLLGMLPKEFTREQVRDLRIKQGMKPDPKGAISKWKQRGLIVAGEAPNTYVRVEVDS